MMTVHVVGFGTARNCTAYRQRPSSYRQWRQRRPLAAGHNTFNICNQGLIPSLPSPVSTTDVVCDVRRWIFTRLLLVCAEGNKRGAKEAPAAAAAGTDGNAGAEFELSTYETSMQRTIDHLQHELANIRTGRATPGMLDHLKLELYGQKMPLKAAGTVSVRNSQLLAVTVFDPSVRPSCTTTLL
jgi:Ribosome recycling factor